MWALLGSIPAEVTVLLELLSLSETQHINGKAAYFGRIGSTDAVVSTTGPGNRRAARQLRHIFQRIDIDGVIFSGCGGRINPSLGIGDQVIAEEIIELNHVQQHGDTIIRGIKSYCANHKLAHWFKKTADSGRGDIPLVSGRVLSSDRAITTPETAAHLWVEWQGHCVEMEGAGIAAVCTETGVPFVVVRAISDLCDQNTLADFHRNCPGVARSLAPTIARLFSTGAHVLKELQRQH